MAPTYTPLELAEIVHTSTTGSKIGPFSIDSKVMTWAESGREIWAVQASRGSNTWSCSYTTNSDGTVGKVYPVTDELGREWSPDRLNGTWA